MHAIRILVRRSWREHAGVSIVLAFVVGLAAALVGASFQAAGVAHTTLARYERRNRVFDVQVQGCPPGVAPDVVASVTALIANCANPTVTARMRHVLDRLPEVERTGQSATLVAALLDPRAPNRWGRIGILDANATHDSMLDRGHPIVVSGRMIRADAPDEVVLSESAALSAGLHVGDEVRMASWTQADLDAAVDGRVKPETTPFRVSVVGIVRLVDDVQPTGLQNLSDTVLGGPLYAGAGWYAAHGAGMASYGTAVSVRLRSTPGADTRFRHALAASPDGWLMQTSALSDVSRSSPQHVIDLQGRAVVVFGGIAALAALAFIGTTLVRQLRREAAEVEGLSALGVTRTQRRSVNLVRALTIGVPAAVVAGAGVVALSPFEPLGLARQLEFDLGVRVDVPVVLLTGAAVLAVFAAFGAIAPVTARRASTRTTRASRVLAAARALGPVSTVGAEVARGRSSRVAVAAAAIAVAAGIAGATLVTGYDGVVGHPRRYGAWWDVAVGDYSDRAPYEHGVAVVRGDADVSAAAAYDDETDAITIDGRAAPLIAVRNLVGHRRPAMDRGRAPTNAHEVALGRDTAAELHANIGDTVRLSVRDRAVEFRVVGIGVIDDPVTIGSGPGKGALATMSGMGRATGARPIPGTIVLAFDRHRPRTAALAPLERDFGGSIRAAVPQLDIQNAGRLRTVPWLLTALVGALALAALVHALVTMLMRHRTTLAVVGAIGFTRAQRRAVAVAASIGLVGAGVLVGIPIGLVLGARLWNGVAAGMGVAPATVLAWRAVTLTTVAALTVATVAALATSGGTLRVRPGQDLRVE